MGLWAVLLLAANSVRINPKQGCWSPIASLEIQLFPRSPMHLATIIAASRRSSECSKVSSRSPTRVEIRSRARVLRDERQRGTLLKAYGPSQPDPSKACDSSTILSLLSHSARRRIEVPTPRQSASILQRSSYCNDSDDRSPQDAKGNSRTSLRPSSIAH